MFWIFYPEDFNTWNARTQTDGTVEIDNQDLKQTRQVEYLGSSVTTKIDAIYNQGCWENRTTTNDGKFLPA